MGADTLFQRLIFVLCLLSGITGCEPTGHENRTADILSQQSQTGFEQVLPGQPLVFPRDHLSHPGFRTEWWYLTANLETEQGQWIAVQWTLFRIATQPFSGAENATGWQDTQRFMAHAVVTTAEKRWQAERFARGGIGQAGVEDKPYRLWLDNWRWQGLDSSPFPGTLTFADASADANMAAELNIRSYGNLVRQGEAGYSQKDPTDPRLASYYYSMPFLLLDGVVTLDGVPMAVKGEGWFDREWSSQAMSEHQTGWDWFSLHLDDGRALMLYQLRSTQHDPFVFGSLSWPDGRSIALSSDQASLTPIATSTLSGREFPTRWHLQVPAQQIDLDVQAQREDQLLPFLFPYWEGPVTASGSHNGQGFMELTGY
ncbi:carotenoid 1,2-hydratase [Photobacterium halotolerans]|uniref:lipocalin-like domain-containing protein n=1 Tax=Photobacterium halotolerans TaxID=265726 RepID=UPI001372BE7E|nr:lipocalin-like domain-containing protein [Photobacterium halotolerans]NAX48136.1 carotenoid 1,2-hydratase [Photobacterium halotolerans]